MLRGCVAKIEASGSRLGSRLGSLGPRLGALGLELEPLEAKFGRFVAKIEASGVKIGPPKPKMRALGPITGHVG